VGWGHTRPDRATSGRVGPEPATAAPALSDARTKHGVVGVTALRSGPAMTWSPAARCEPRIAQRRAPTRHTRSGAGTPEGT
jgi:hypothetical protein